MNGLGKHLRALRTQAGLTQAEIGYRAGISREVVCAIENGRTNPRIGTVKRYCEAIGARIVIGFPPKEQK
ncbi:helix-turn-helix transcriptional regulator [Amycolatopsis echigonensis]|uniref:Helix-turn-helix transcriptional regulator n=1 Tax=Amycolatopsis echigonensis TaxID=2576905 RepID=A0A8E1W7P5_9PSEU|nr:helix-turn-helix transcriptional regulator [Amycolatopsis echigonensis]MBB2506018.1 helix-turn-helix transcriptional regulator [Amycolatopsis echigonensis]